MFEHVDEEEHLAVDVCRAENCPAEYVHRAHIFPLTAAEAEEPPWWLQKGQPQRQDPAGIRESLRRIFAETDWPLGFRDVAKAIRNDYGSISSRTLHRYISAARKEGLIVELDLDLIWKAYIRADSRFRHDRDNLREHILGRRMGVLSLEGCALGVARQAYA